MKDYHDFIDFQKIWDFLLVKVHLLMIYIPIFNDKLSHNFPRENIKDNFPKVMRKR